jgi:hypothetical protein
MTSFPYKCVIWGTPAKGKDINVDGFQYDSPRTDGEYLIVRSATLGAENLPKKEKTLLTSWLIDQRESGVVVPTITTDTLRSVQNMKPMEVIEREDRTLQCLEKMSASVGARFILVNHSPDFDMLRLLAWSGSLEESEVRYFIESLSEKGLINLIPREHKQDSEKIQLTSIGYEHLKSIKAERQVVNSKQVFVAMWFDDSMESVYNNSIYPAIKRANYKPMHIGKKESTGKIDDEVRAEIKRSEIVVADLTHGDDGARGSVYYEAGYAHALDKPVHFTCKEGVSPHFDIRNHRIIFWKDEKELYVKLLNRFEKAPFGDEYVK